ncbi:MAG: hypothetical protein A2Y62_20565 [Candidatus Fischerbacteria bacterium RBG_13_37_8]|uniref:Pilus assembly protein PilP n=1 Tax=Candidatus Fischerbacteria bacterium RBG_13_37_8 TaxID=1817863 RepID=A0A1F5VEE7_9BACT|nr:MAG: hypothetical protein A2Y62_20565 [Candidatus Fischerbacteria bacterium RBG_13_37_8]
MVRKWLLINLFVICVLGVYGIVLNAQEAGATPEQQPAQAASADDQANMDEMQEIDSSYFYDPTGKRDPFLPLKRGTKKKRADTQIPCPAGCLISEMELQGIVKDSSNNYIAIFSGPDKKSYNMRVGDKFFDGEITSIDIKKVVLKEEVQDPTEIIKFREVIKWLHPTSEQRY